MRNGWRTLSLGDICEIVKGTSPTLKTPPGDYPLIVTGPEPSTSDKFQFEGEAVCVPLVSSTGHGHASLKRVHYASGRFAVASIMAACVVRDPLTVNTRFLLHYLQHVKDDEIVTRMKGTANVSLSIANLKTVPIVLPPLDEQRRILDIISVALDAAAAAEAEATASVTLLGALLDKHVLEGKNLRTITEVAVPPRGLVGGPFGSSLVRSDYREAGVPVVRGANMPGLLRRELRGEYVFVTEEKADSLATNLALPGDVIFTQRGTIGQVGLVPEGVHPRYVVSQSQMRLRVAPELSSAEYVRHIFTAPAMVTRLRAQDRATANPHINLGVLAKTAIPVPSLQTQRLLVDEWSSLEASGLAALAFGDAIRALLPEMLSVLLSGKHEIPVSYDELLRERAA